jgi:hypothetical protein
MSNSVQARAARGPERARAAAAAGGRGYGPIAPDNDADESQPQPRGAQPAGADDASSPVLEHSAAADSHDDGAQFEGQRLVSASELAERLQGTHSGQAAAAQGEPQPQAKPSTQASS